MKKIISIATILFQLFTAFIGLLIIYLIFALLDMNDFDLPSGIGFVIFQPVFGIVLSGLTIIACFILGLPIRLIPRLNIWWSGRPFLIFIGITLGLTLLISSLFFKERVDVLIDGAERTKEIPNIILALTGWFLTAFSLLHFYPVTILKWLKKKIWTYATITQVA